MNTPTPTTQPFPSAPELSPQVETQTSHERSKMERGAESFPENIEELVSNYLLYQARRSGYGEITVYTSRSRARFDELAVYHFAVLPDGKRSIISANSISDAADRICNWANGERVPA